MKPVKNLKIGDYVVLNEGGTIKSRFIKVTQISYSVDGSSIVGVNYQRNNGCWGFSGRQYWEKPTVNDYKEYVDYIYNESLEKN